MSDYNKQSHISKWGFSLIELLVSIAVIATIIGLALPNFLGARIRARDARKKGELNQVKTALQLYYNDYKVYPPAGSGGIGKLNYIAGCGSNGTTLCPATCSVAFSAGADCATATVYMTRFPEELGSSMYYYQMSSGADFCLKVPLENNSDGDAIASQARCAFTCPDVASGMEYIVCSE